MYSKTLSQEDVDCYIHKLKAINWKGFKLWLVGGCLEEWDTRDIDICILGELNSKQLFSSIEEARSVGPFDMYYVKELKSLDNGPYSISYAKSHDRCCKNANQRPGEWIDGLFWQQKKFPMDKHKEREYTKKPLLIHDGTL